MYVWAAPSHAKYSRWSCGPPPYVANGLPSTRSETDETPTLVHLSSIMVGALHEMGDAGVTVNPLNALRPEIVVPVPPVEEGPVDVVVGRVLDGGGDEALDDEAATELETVVDVGGVLLFLSLLQAVSASTPTTQASVGPRRKALRPREAMKKEARAIRLRILVGHVWLRRYRAEQCQRW